MNTAVANTELKFEVRLEQVSLLARLDEFLEMLIFSSEPYQVVISINKSITSFFMDFDCDKYTLQQEKHYDLIQFYTVKDKHHKVISADTNVYIIISNLTQMIRTRVMEILKEGVEHEVA